MAPLLRAAGTSSQAPGRVSADIPSALLSCSEGGRGQLRDIASPERGRFKSWPQL